MNKRALIVILGLVVLLLCIGIFFEFRSSPLKGDATDVRTSEKAHTESFFSGKTPKEALVLFKSENEHLPGPEQHEKAHVFGEVLYAHEGLSGLTVCDGSFGFGCYHSFLGSAITDYGPEVVKKLDASCVEKYGPGGIGCFHGIGHGLLSYYGYSLSNVEHALSECKGLSWKRPLGGCADGVFMEYNFRIMEKNPADRSRVFNMEERYQPCDTLSIYKEGCYFGLPAWWASVLQEDSSLPATLGDFCEYIDDATMRRACYRGIGYGILPQTQFDAKTGELFCDAVATGEARVLCREGLAWAFYADPATRDMAEGICTNGLSATEAKLCIEEYLFVTQ